MQNKVCLVTGAASGIGRGVAFRLGAEGASVAVADLNIEGAGACAEQIRQAGGKAEAFRVDMGRVASIRKMVTDVHGKMGSIDLLVNSAGVMQTKGLMDLTEEDWDRVFDIDLKGTFFALQAVADVMEKAGRGGVILNLSSVAARIPRPFAVHYSAAKLGVISVTQSAAVSLAPHGIRVNAICPGYVPTPMWDLVASQRANLFNQAPGEARKQILSTIPLGRPGTTDEIAEAVLYLASDRGNYITGQTLSVCGGMTMDGGLSGYSGTYT